MRNEAGAGPLRLSAGGPKPDAALPSGCEFFEGVSSLAGCLTIKPLSGHSTDDRKPKIALPHSAANRL